MNQEPDLGLSTRKTKMELGWFTNEGVLGCHHELSQTSFINLIPQQPFLTVSDCEQADQYYLASAGGATDLVSPYLLSPLRMFL